MDDHEKIMDIFNENSMENVFDKSLTPLKDMVVRKKKFSTSAVYGLDNSSTKKSQTNIPIPIPIVNNEVTLTSISNQLTQLMSNVSSLDSRLTVLETKMDIYFKENIIHKSEEMAQQKTMRECKVLIRKIHHSVCRITGEEVDNVQIHIASTLPLTTLTAAFEVEENLKSEDYFNAMKVYVLKQKGASENVDDVLRHIYSDEFLYACNWDGRGGKQPLSKFSLTTKILYEAFIILGITSFETQIRKSLNLSHNRLKQQKYRMKKSNDVKSSIV